MAPPDPLSTTARPFREDDVVITQRDGTKRIIRHRRYLARPAPEAAAGPRLPDSPPGA
jgi:hypothetical protein